MAKINKDTEEVNNIINEVDLMDIHIELYTLLIKNIPSLQAQTWDIHKNLIIYLVTKKTSLSSTSRNITNHTLDAIQLKITVQENQEALLSGNLKMKENNNNKNY